MILNNYGYNTVKSFKDETNSFSSLNKNDSITDVFSYEIKNGIKVFKPNSIAFVNTSEATKSARYFKKHGVYTKADPVYDKYEYNRFWNEEERKRKEGITLYGELFRDGDGYYNLKKINITGEHYGYLNYAKINKVPDAYEDIEENTLSENVMFPKEYDFPDFWDGDYFYFNALELCRRNSKHLVLAKARRKGYSYKNGWVCANRADLYPNTVTCITAYNKSSLYPKGTFSMADDYLQFIYEHTDWRKRRLRDSDGFIKFGYKLKNSPSVERGFKSSIIAEPFGPAQPGVLRGKDGTVIFVEEGGKARNLDEFLDSTLPTLKAGKYVTGLMVVFGTGGGKDSYWEQFEELFYDPDTNDFMVFENLFDKNSDEDTCGYFVPDFNNKEGFYDEFGNSDTVEAAKFELDYRDKLKKKGKLEKLKNRSMEYAFSPKEAFNRSSYNIFPKEYINEQIQNIRQNPLLKNLKREGIVTQSTKGYIFKDFNLMSSEEYDLLYKPSIWDTKLNTGKDNHGCFVQFFAPHKINGQIPDNLYRVWHDPFSVDKEKNELTNKHSFGCAYVYERANPYTKSRGDRLVGVYIGRPETTERYNEILYSITKYYNAKCFYEKNVGDVYTFFRKMEDLESLVDTPSNIFNKKDNSLSQNKPKGIHINDEKKLNGAMYLKDWLIAKVDKDSNGNWLRNIHYIYDEALLKELLKWNLKGNFDRVSTLIVGMYDVKESHFLEIEHNTPETSSDNIFDREWN